MTDAPPATVVRAATVLTASGPVSDAEVVVEGGTIVAVRPATGAVTVEVLAPGFVDLQMNGIGTVDVAAAEGDDWDVLDAALLAQGVTTWCPTLVSAPLAAMEAALDAHTARPPPGRRGRVRTSPEPTSRVPSWPSPGPIAPSISVPRSTGVARVAASGRAPSSPSPPSSPVRSGPSPS